MKCPICKRPTAGLVCPVCMATLMADGRIPPADLPAKTWVLCKRSEKEFLFITIHNRLVMFDSKTDAEDILPLLAKGHVDVTGITTEEVPSTSCWAYAILRDLELAKAVRTA